MSLFEPQLAEQLARALSPRRGRHVLSTVRYIGAGRPDYGLKSRRNSPSSDEHCVLARKESLLRLLMVLLIAHLDGLPNRSIDFLKQSADLAQRLFDLTDIVTEPRLMERSSDLGVSLMP